MANRQGWFAVMSFAVHDQRQVQNSVTVYKSALPDRAYVFKTVA